MNILKFLLTDNESLAAYENGKLSTIDDIKRRIFLKAREENRVIPDHYYRLAKEETFENISSIGQLLTNALPKLADNYLTLSENRIWIRSNKQNDWQQLLTYMPPLLLQSALLYKKKLGDFKGTDRYLLFSKYILPNTRHTSIPGSRIPQLDYFLQQQSGLHDLHMHLNGTLETDQVWQDYLSAPKKIHKDLKSSLRKDKALEQMEQESSQLDADRFRKLFQTAQKLRSFFYSFLFPSADNEYKGLNTINLLQRLISDKDMPGSYEHPFLELISSKDGKYPFMMSVEGLMYIVLLDAIEQTKNEVLAGLFHFYLLILGLTNRLLVQQTHQRGFEQFQKHTLNGLRWHSEHTYFRRYFQLHGNDYKHIHFLEGRFAPNKDREALVKLLKNIWDGWDTLQKEIKRREEDEGIKVAPPRLKLTAHFIKQQDEKPDEYIRHKDLRLKTTAEAFTLAQLLKNHREQYSDKISAVDAAASEFDASPEVFARAYRIMRRAGIKHFTYHAGEDFFHLIGGLRAIYEAIVFCDLRNGDRIGHAVAAGLPVHLWEREIGNEFPIRQGQYMDDLIFAYHLIVNGKIESLQTAIPFIINKVQEISFDVFDKHYPISVLEKAWLMREYCPLHAFKLSVYDQEPVTLSNDDEWNFLLEEGIIDCYGKIPSNTPWKLFEKYHTKICRDQYDKIITIQPFEILKPEQVETLQLALLQEMNRREIVIETLPTSNVRIGFHKDFSTYHLYNWIKWREEGKSIPPIVVGSDDTGIFATNIYNEYANIYCALLHHHHMPHARVMEVIKKLDEDSRIYRFE